MLYIIYRGAFYPLQVGDNTVIGDDTIVNATSIGAYVYVGKNCVIVSCIEYNFDNNYVISQGHVY